MSTKIAARIDAAVNAARAGGDPAAPITNGDGGAPAAPTEGAPAPSANPAPASGQQTPENILETQTPETPQAPQVNAELRAAIDAKLAAQRAKRQAAEEAKAAKAAREEAERIKSEALTEKQKYDALKTGSFKETLEALGRNPREVFEGMQREMIEAGTPEAEIRKMRAEFEKQISEKLAPLSETVEQLKAENEALKAEKAQSRAAAYQARLEGAFTREVQAEDLVSLRVEYSDADLFEYVDHFDKNPAEFHAAAREYNVPLTDPSKGFTMREILLVLKAAQDAHEQGKQQRQAKLAPPPAPAAPSAPTKTPTVNGTAERRNAGQTIGQDLAQERASAGARLSRKDRVQAEIERLSGR